LTLHPTAEIISIGDRLFPGGFSLHSRFRRVVNFTDGEAIVAVVAEEIGRGPVNIVVRGIDLSEVKKLRIDAETIRIGEQSFPYDQSRIFNSRIDRGMIEEEKLTGNLQFLEEALLDFSSPLSLAFLIDPNRRAYFKTLFEKNFVTAVSDAVGLIFDGRNPKLSLDKTCFKKSPRLLRPSGARNDFTKTGKELQINSGDKFIVGIKKIKGVGFGLTPSGDDFVAGLLAALNLLESLDGINRKDLKSEIAAAARGGNPLSNSFITLARDGFLFERFQRMISTLLRGNKNQIRTAAKILFFHGETSGSDMAVGFLLTIKFFAAGKKFSDSDRVGD